MFSSMLAALATRVGPISPAIIFKGFHPIGLRSGHTNLLLLSRVAVSRFSSGIANVLDKVVRESAGGALI